MAVALCSLRDPAQAAQNPRQQLNADHSFSASMAAGLEQRQQGKWSEAAASFERAADAARRANSAPDLLQSLLRLTACRIRLFQYRQALESSDAASTLAFGLNDDTSAGVSGNNRATIYSQLGDYQLAAQAAQNAVVLLRRSPHKDFLAQALLNLGDIQSELRHPQSSVDAFQNAVTVARAAGFQAVEAMALDHLGTSLIEAGDLAGAEKALLEARRIRIELKDSDQLAITNENLAMLAYRKNDLGNALRLSQTVLASGSSALLELPPFGPVHLHAEILLAMGRRSQALAEFDKAVVLADNWRLGSLPGDSTSTRTVVYLHDVYQDYVQLAAEIAQAQHNQALARRALEVLAENRGSSLREQMLSVLGRSMQLPPRYFELLSTLQATQALVTLKKNPAQLQANQLKLKKIRLELNEIENQIGIRQRNSSAEQEKNLSRNSLRNLQSKLSPRELLLSFSLGSRNSLLWAVTGDQVTLYQLPAEDTIAAHARAFTEAIRRNAPGNAEGLVLCRELFGQLSPKMKQRPDWLIAADGALLNGIPFSALCARAGAPDAQPLIAAHSLRFLPSELLLTDPKPARPEPRFVGVGDPIYNLADSRRERHFTLLPATRASGAPIALARLVGSDREIRSSAKTSGLPNAQILTGSAASGPNVRAALLNRPEIVHFAVHVVSPERPGESDSGESSSPEEAALALSLTKDDIPELLTKENVAALRMPGALVVLSGCSSQQGENLPSAGLIGLSRSFLLAGAAAVVVSAWPTPDDSGKFFSTFYTHFRAGADATAVGPRAAEALRQTQADMSSSTNPQNLPSFWAAYSLISKE